MNSRRRTGILSRPARQYLVTIAVVIAVAAVIGLLTGQTATIVALALAALLLLQARNLVRLEHWLRNRSTERPPDMRGVWGEVVAITSRIYRRKVFHKRRMLAVVREFRRMTSAMPDGAILLGPNREILWFNRTARLWLNLKRRVDFGLRIDNLVRHPDFVAYLDRGGTTAPPRIQLPMQQDRWLSLRLITSHATGRLLLLRDVTSEARLEAMRRDFVANVSHELRSPLTVIGGYLDALAEDPGLDPGWQLQVQEMRRQSERMRAIVQDLLELSTLESQSGAAEESPVDIGGMLAQLRKEVLARPKRPATVAVSLESDALLLGSENELHSIFANLLSNAANYTTADGRIDVRWWTDASGGHVEVRDTGIGIPAEHLPRLTERFYRVDAGRSRELGGSGLGLAIVKHALQRHGGSLDMRSEEGKGSAFTCHFPGARVRQRAATSL